ncbi:MAG TPA: 3-hydroxyacyl-CoA dehydrogenase family protein [Fulvivirga sp.]|nr:3-hydroxyacyl-CoA dehydrogenase family protein [Fulvivirga sp.]
MNILIVGGQVNLEEVKLKLGSKFQYSILEAINEDTQMEGFDYIFDFIIDEMPEHFEYYTHCTNPIIFINTVKVTIAELQYTYGQSTKNIYGFNGLPTFFNREVIEISSLSKKDPDKKLQQLGTDFIFVDDRVGMVTPRIILMIINEAYYTVQEGTASKEDIDQGMKLGTNYPFGPFEWSKKIGLQHVYETLEAIYEDTKDERYKIAPLLKKEYLS